MNAATSARAYGQSRSVVAAGADELEENVGAFAIDRQVAELIDDHEAWDGTKQA